jgi:DNA-binding winged helix-turn-helix (wHTH) protein/tetratricopeptide (TPR) repeat protein
MHPDWFFPPFRIDGRGEQLWRETQAIDLRPKTFAVLCYLVEHAGQLVTKEELLNTVWPDTIVGDAVLKVSIGELREALGDKSETPRFIATVHRRGYRFLPTVTTQPVVNSQHSVVSREDEKQKAKVAVPLPAPNTQPPTLTLVGRGTELAHLHSLFDKALNGERQVVFVTGEAGIGKTALVESFLSGVQSHEAFRVSTSPKSKIQSPKLRTPNSELSLTPDPWLARGQCIEHYGTGEPYLPIFEALGRLCRGPEGAQFVTLLRQDAPTWLMQMPSLVGEDDREALRRQTVEASQQRMLREFADVMEMASAQVPVILVVEDLHWSDTATLDSLSLLAQRTAPARLLIIGTYRPAELIVSNHPLKRLKQELERRGRCEELALELLSPTDVQEYVQSHVLEDSADETTVSVVTGLVHRRTDGHPLFMTTLLSDLVRRELVVREGDSWKVRVAAVDIERSVPESMQLLLERQKEQLTSDEQRLLEAASVVGREFTAAAVAAALEAEPEQVEEWCDGLVRRRQFLQPLGVMTWPDGTLSGHYEFVHSVHQDVLYEGTLPLRRARWHQRVGQRTEAGYGSRAAELAAVLALHFERGRQIEKAIQYRGHGAQTALQRGAPLEAMTHLHRALALLEPLPDTPARVQQELSLQVTLGSASIAAKGLGAEEVERAFSRARVLCQQVEDSPLNIPILIGLGIFYLSRAEFQIGTALAEQSLRLAESAQDTASILTAHLYLAANYHESGELRTARGHYEQTLQLYDPQRHSQLSLLTGQDPGASAGAMSAWALWLLGYPEQSQRRVQWACTHARNLGHANTVAICLMVQFVGHALRGELSAALVSAEECMTFSLAQGVPAFAALGRVAKGWTLVRQGQADEGIASLRVGLADYTATGSRVNLSWWLLLFVDACWHAGQVEEGLAALTEAVAFVEQTGERLCEAELWRLKGELLLRKVQGPRSEVQSLSNPQSPVPNPQKEAEGCFLKAIDIARRQQAKSLELRAVISLVRLRQRRVSEQGAGSREQEARLLSEAHSMLSALYDWFTEGFDTKDLQEAQKLLAKLKQKPEAVKPAKKRSTTSSH